MQLIRSLSLLDTCFKHLHFHPKSSMIPLEYLSKMGTFSIEVEGSPFEVNVVDHDNKELVERHLNELINSLQDIKVVGVDSNSVNDSPEVAWHRGIRCPGHILVLCAAKRGLIIHFLGRCLGSSQTPEALLNFLQDPTICFVKGRSVVDIEDKVNFSGRGIEVGDLAARVLRKPSMEDSSLADIAREVGVQCNSLPLGVDEPIEGTRVMTEEHVELAISTAFPICLIGHKLLSSL